MTAALVLCFGAFIATAEVAATTESMTTTVTTTTPATTEVTTTAASTTTVTTAAATTEVSTTTASTTTTTTTTTVEVLPRFLHTEEDIVKIGATGEVTIVVSELATLIAKSDGKGKIVLQGDDIPEGTKIVKESEGSIWKFHLATSPICLTIELLENDCVPTVKATTSPATTAETETSTASPTTTAATEVATTSPTTTTATEVSTSSPTTTTATEVSTSSPTTTAEASESRRRLEANEDKSTTESSEEEEEEEEESTEASALTCDQGYVCNASLKSCEVETSILPAGSAGKIGNNSDAVQNSLHAILVAMVAYLLM
eukprot:GEMP01045297.1.p1 GENE.GEMP01045297.1~~GEMP01045297.1.p1  ORF type:complete len:316 (+),score=55.24 GEMP01045297.1:63-1010(+)